MVKFGGYRLYDPEVIRLLQLILSDRRISYRETISLLRSTLDDDAVTAREFDSLKAILQGSKTLDRRSRNLIEEFIRIKFQPKKKFLGQTFLTKNFRLEEFHCKHGIGTEVPQEYVENIQKLCDNLQIIRDTVGKPLNINSGFRTKKHQKFLKDKGLTATLESQHCFGKAADIKIVDGSNKLLYETIVKLVENGDISEGGIGLYANFVHYDIRGTRARWG